MVDDSMDICYSMQTSFFECPEAQLPTNCIGIERVICQLVGFLSLQQLRPLLVTAFSVLIVLSATDRLWRPLTYPKCH